MSQAPASAPSSTVAAPQATHVARWDLDKTYLRTEFDTVRDLVRTAFERADEKRTNPGAATLIRDMSRSGSEIHILSGSPEQMRGRLTNKLKLDGVTFASLVLKPNLRNVLRLRFRAVRDQLGYKLPALLKARSLVQVLDGAPLPLETCFGDDAEADAFVYAIYADYCEGAINEETLRQVLELGEVYDDVIESALLAAKKITRGATVERIYIHLEAQSSPADYRVYGPRVVPFYNYFQAALALFEERRITAEGLLRVAAELVREHRFDGPRLVRSYLELAQRGHLKGASLESLSAASERVAFSEQAKKAATNFVAEAARLERAAQEQSWTARDESTPAYAQLVLKHNRRHK
jgi:hypothetical protein